MRDLSATLRRLAQTIASSAIGIATALLVAGAGIAQTASPPAPMPPLSTVTTARSIFRMTVNLEYRGEPTAIDVVAACAMRITRSAATGTSFDPSLVPDVYALRTKDGKAILVQTPGACEGETTANGRVPNDFLPIVVVYQDADTMQFGVGYFSLDAYENPLSELKFKGATIASSSLNELNEWRKTAPRNVLRPEMRPWNPVFARDRPVPFQGQCFGVRRLALPPQIQARVRGYWPEDRPRYWQPPPAAHYELRQAMWGHDYQPDSPRFEGHAWTAYLLGDRDTRAGLPTPSGGGKLGSRGQKFPAAIFPVRLDLGVPWAGPRLAAQDSIYLDIETRGGAAKGMMYCYGYTQAFLESETILKAEVPGLLEKPRVCRVDDKLVVGPSPCDLDQTMIFESDTHVFASHRQSFANYPGASE